MDAPVQHHAAALTLYPSPGAGYAVRPHYARLDAINFAHGLLFVHIPDGEIIVVPTSVLMRGKHYARLFSGFVHLFGFLA